MRQSFLVGALYVYSSNIDNKLLLVEDGLIVGGAIVFKDKTKVNIGRIFVDVNYHRKGYGIYIMNAIESLYPDVTEYVLDTPIWNVRTNSFYQKLGYNEIKRDSEFVYYSKTK